MLVIVPLGAVTGETGAFAELEDGSPVPPLVLDRWKCETAIGRVLMGGDSLPLDVGKVTYTPTAAQRRALVARDRTCRVPNCHRKAIRCDIDHRHDWILGGDSDPEALDNFAMAQTHRLILREERNFVEAVDSTLCLPGPPKI